MKRELKLLLFSFSVILYFAGCAFCNSGKVVIDSKKVTENQVRPVWTRINLWDLSIAKNYKPAPFIREAILMTATGGRNSSQMYYVNEKGEVYYDFSKIEAALDSVLAHKLLPMIVLGNTPVKLSDLPDQKGDFNINPGRPTSYQNYSAYIKALFGELVRKYGKANVESWQYRLMTEPDNKGWWRSGWSEYQKIYDFTVAAARSVAPGVVIDGGNLMTPDIQWTKDWAEWIVSNAGSFNDNAIPRKVNEVSFSCYGGLGFANQMGDDPRNLVKITQKFREDSKALGNVEISVGEGQILHDEQDKYLWYGDGTELGAAWNAAIVKACHDANLSRYVQWDFTSDGVKSPSYNVLMMCEKILGSKIVDSDLSLPKSVPDKSYIDTIPCVDQYGNMRVLLFHYNPNRNARYDIELELKIKNIAKGNYLIKHWRVDKHKSNFFTQWLKDSHSLVRLDKGANSGSKWDMEVISLLDKDGKKIWKKKKDEYLKQDKLEFAESGEDVLIEKDFTKKIKLPVNSVSLIEILKK